jgi:hypothetical protein
VSAAVQASYAILKGRENLKVMSLNRTKLGSAIVNGRARCNRPTARSY